MTTLLHIAAPAEQEGRYQYCARCRLILQDFRVGEVGVIGFGFGPAGARAVELPALMLPTWDGLVGVDEKSGAHFHVDAANAGAYVACRPKCGFSIAGESCKEWSVYDLDIGDCAYCHRRGALLCLTHPACAEHGAKLRGDVYEWAFGDGDVDDRGDVSVERISATYRPVAS